MARLSIGRYVAYDTFIHRLDPRNKILALILLMVAIFFQFSTYEVTFIVDGILALFIFGLMIVSKIRFKDFIKSLSALWFMILLLLIINIFIPGPNKEAYGVAWTMWNYDVYWASIFQSIKITIRLILMISLTLILTQTTKPLDLTFAFEWFLAPLKLFKFPTHVVAMTLSIALRFIPTILDETHRIMNAQTSRGVDFKHGKFVEKMHAIVSLIVPLFVSAFERSDELADAMEARGYNPKGKRTRFRKPKWSFKDSVSLLYVSAITAGVVVVSVLNLAITSDLFFAFSLLVEFAIFIIFVLIGIFYTTFRRKV